MTHDKATKRPWAWEWDSLNMISIYQPTEGLHPIVVAEVPAEPQEDQSPEECKAIAEADAELIVSAVNALMF